MMRWPFVLLAVASLACTAPQTVALPPDGPQTADDVLSRALARPIAKTAQGMARLDAYVKNERRSVDLIVQLAMPDHTQLQAVTPTLDMIAVMATDGKRFVSFERGGEKCSVGEACPRNMARLVPIALAPDQLTPALLGRPPILNRPDKRLDWDGTRGLYRVTVGTDASAHQQVFVSPKDFRIVGTVLYDGTERLASMEYIDGDRVPKMLRYKAKDLDVSVTLKDDFALDQPVDDEAFALACPDGMLKQEMPCTDPEPVTPTPQKAP